MSEEKKYRTAEEKKYHDDRSLPLSHRRSIYADYKGRGIYLVTLCTEDRQPLLGTLCGDSAEAARIEPKPLGRRVQELWEGIPRFQREAAERVGVGARREIRILATQLMPDHLHGILFVEHEMDIPLGRVIGGFMMACTKAFNEGLALGCSALGVYAEGSTSAGSTAEGSTAEGSTPKRPLWQKGYHDRRLTRRGQLQNMIDYVRDNPRRLWLRRHSRELFAVYRGVKWYGRRFSVVGNLQCMDARLVAVHVRRRFTEKERRDYMNGCILAARQGAVLIGAFISEHEKRVREVALREGWPVVQVCHEAFSDFYKPSGELFDACAKGLLLLLHEEAVNPSAYTPRAQQPSAQPPRAQQPSAHPPQPRKGAANPYWQSLRKISRAECMALNTLAEELAAKSTEELAAKSASPIPPKPD